MIQLSNYMQDGANYQARCVLMYLQPMLNRENIYVSRWENCREQGYILRIESNNNNKKPLNIIWFEHRNSDSIHAVCWEQNSMNSITIDTMDKSIPYYNNKWATNFSVPCMEIKAMGNWIINYVYNYLN